jgi:anti-anti-sigma factor
MSSDWDIRTDRVGQHLWVVSAPGEGDLADVDELEAVFDTVFEHGSTVVVDLSETTFIDSAVVGLLVSRHQRVEHNDAHQLAVVAPPRRHPRRILDMTASMLPVLDDLPTAVAAEPDWLLAGGCGW